MVPYVIHHESCIPAHFLYSLHDALHQVAARVDLPYPLSVSSDLVHRYVFSARVCTVRASSSVCARLALIHLFASRVVGFYWVPVTDRRKKKNAKAQIFTPNHISIWDPFYLHYYCGVSPAAKADLFDVRVWCVCSRVLACLRSQGAV